MRQRETSYLMLDPMNWFLIDPIVTQQSQIKIGSHCHLDAYEGDKLMEYHRHCHLDAFRLQIIYADSCT
uniref:Uncharacterized protein n=1 Tax=Arundo donax TaxID=35708 RepID=A0A0A8ZP34_ARUDO